MDESKQLTKALTFLAEITAWQGEEDYFASCKRMVRVERFLKKIAPELLRAEKAKAKAFADGG